MRSCVFYFLLYRLTKFYYAMFLIFIYVLSISQRLDRIIRWILSGISATTVTLVMTSLVSIVIPDCESSPVEDHRKRPWKRISLATKYPEQRGSFSRFMRRANALERSKNTGDAISISIWTRRNKFKLAKYNLIRGCLRGSLLPNFVYSLVSIIETEIVLIIDIIISCLHIFVHLFVKVK